MNEIYCVRIARVSEIATFSTFLTSIREVAGYNIGRSAGISEVSFFTSGPTARFREIP
jgi:hypothetical protein